MAKQRRLIATPVAEGVRLELDRYTVFAVRNEEKDISVRVRREPRAFLIACMHIPFLRGAARLIRDVIRFFDGLIESAELHPQRPVKGTEPERRIALFLHIRPQSIVTLVSAILILLTAFVCLYAFPEGAAALLRMLPLPRLWLNLIAAAVRVIGLLFGVGVVGRLRVFKRLLMYKGAANKVINCYECGEEVNAQSVADYPILTRRSESAFLLCALGVALLLFPLIPPMHALVGALLRVAVLLGVAAVLNEPFSLVERLEPTPFVQVLRAPMDLLQHMTTLEPHPQMIEVAVCAFNASMGRALEAETEVTPNDDRGMDEERD